MELAPEALVERRPSVFEVSESVGYQLLPTFSRAFKEYFGVGPGEVWQPKEHSRIVGFELATAPGTSRLHERNRRALLAHSSVLIRNTDSDLVEDAVR
jgi:AraC-like DNA-binding protein